MQIRNVAHEGLRRFILDDDAAGLIPADATRMRRIVSFLQDMAWGDEPAGIPGWNLRSSHMDDAERLSVPVADRGRLTFRIDNEQAEIIDLDWLESR